MLEAKEQTWGKELPERIEAIRQSFLELQNKAEAMKTKCEVRSAVDPESLKKLPEELKKIKETYFRLIGGLKALLPMPLSITPKVNDDSWFDEGQLEKIQESSDPAVIMEAASRFLRKIYGHAKNIIRVMESNEKKLQLFEKLDIGYDQEAQGKLTETAKMRNELSFRNIRALVAHYCNQKGDWRHTDNELIIAIEKIKKDAYFSIRTTPLGLVGIVKSGVIKNSDQMKADGERMDVMSSYASQRKTTESELGFTAPNIAYGVYEDRKNKQQRHAWYGDVELVYDLDSFGDDVTLTLGDSLNPSGTQHFARDMHDKGSDTRENPRYVQDKLILPQHAAVAYYMLNQLNSGLSEGNRPHAYLEMQVSEPVTTDKIKEVRINVLKDEEDAPVVKWLSDFCEKNGIKTTKVVVDRLREQDTENKFMRHVPEYMSENYPWLAD